MAALSSGWEKATLDHWREFRPTMVADLRKSGKLDSAVKRAVKQTTREMDELLDAGMDWNQAWEMTREKYMYLPEERRLV